jgi:signal transduction histidine kinase
MKLINKISNYFLISAAITFAVFAIMLYVIVQHTITNEVDEQLTNVYQKVVKELTAGQKADFPPFVEINDLTSGEIDLGYKNVSLQTNEESEGEGEPFRQYTSVTEIDGEKFVVTVRISLIEKEDMFFSIFFVTVGAVFFFLIVLFLINKFSSQKVLKDFYNTLTKLENFSLAYNDKLELNNSKIKEFTKLNEVVEKLSEKAKGEYRSLKEFTEESNHELQTPVAVVKSKLEMLLQSENLKQEELSLVNAAINNLNKLERINKSILLLNKLDHKNLFEESQINLSEEIKNVISNYSDFIDSKKIYIKTNLDSKSTIVVNNSLLNILLNNLISNSVRHNLEGGQIEIELKEKKLIIKNTGVPLTESSENMFKKFQKGNKNYDSIGLGLAIVKKICDLYTTNIHYETINDKHIITLIFNR